MNGYVIAIKGHKKSETASVRCIASGTKFDFHISPFWAITPENNPEKMLNDLDIPTEKFREKYSRPENCMAAFLSHYSLWQKCVETNKPMAIFEHDAVIVDNIPTQALFNKVMNIGAPSYGRFNQPAYLGVGPLVSKPYFPGAHAYMIKPAGAKELIEGAKTKPAGPTDLYLSVMNFPWLQEFNPWPVECRDSFTTIQNETGCLAKHNYVEGEYEII